MSNQHVPHFVTHYRAADDYVYLLLDALGDCADQSIDIASFTESLGQAAVVRVLRPDLAHDPASCPALIQLAAPGQIVSMNYLESSAHHAMEGVNYDKRYVCGWIISRQPAKDIAQHIAHHCHTLAPLPGRTSSPWFEPLRLELLQGAMGPSMSNVIAPIKHWLIPNSWGSYNLIDGADVQAQQEMAIPQLARDTQQDILLVRRVLQNWRHLIKQPMHFTPWRWKGETALPPQAAVHAFRLIRDAKRQGLRNVDDMIALSTWRLMVHPLLPQHPSIKHEIEAAAAGHTSLEASFSTYNSNRWKRIFGELPSARDYT